MKGKPSGRLIQVALGLLLVAASVFYLWKGTVRPILKSSPSLESVADAVGLDPKASSWRERVESARARALEALEADRERLKGGERDGKEP